MKNLNAIELSQKLIQIPSYSGHNKPIINLIKDYLADLDFKCDILDFAGDGSYKVNNLHAVFNPNNYSQILYFAGHTDIVNEGNKGSWRFPPFSATISEDKLYGRGASDMKCAIACFMIAVKEFLYQNKSPKFGIGFLITNDEEADGVNGTKKVLNWMRQNNHKISSCIVGEPTNPSKFGEMMKIGRRGSVSFSLKVIGKQGHVAYPQIALNPNTIMVNILRILKDHKFDDGNKFFDATNLEVTAIESQNLGGNVIPNEVSANFNVRFNDNHSGQDIVNLVKYVCDKSVSNLNDIEARYDLQFRISGESFLCQPKKIANLAKESIIKNCNIVPEFSTSGGTSDARFIKDYCSDMVELGLINETAHKIDECSKIEDVTSLKNVYLDILQNYSPA
jgi:succinyl-diaminopimelate desuccinylase